MGMQRMLPSKGGLTMSGQTTANRGRSARETTTPVKDKKATASRTAAPASQPATKSTKRAKDAEGAKGEAQSKISILIVDDHPVFRGGLRGLLELDDAIQVIGEAQDGLEALEMARAL